MRESWLPERVGNYSLCIRLVNRALKCIEGVEGAEAEELRTGLWGVYAAHRYFQGRNREAIEWGAKAAEASERIGYRQGCAQAYLSMSLAYADTGDLKEAERFSELALALYEELEQLEPQAQVLNNMGTFSYFAGRWDEAVERWDRSRELRLRTGDAVEAANGTNNVAEVLSDQGHLAEAEARFREALRVWKAAGFQGGVAYALANLGRVAYRDGRPAEALPMLREARALFGASGFVAQVLETDTRIAECHLVAHQPGDALEVADGALAVESSRDGLGYQRAALLRARAYALAATRPHRGRAGGARGEPEGRPGAAGGPRGRVHADRDGRSRDGRCTLGRPARGRASTPPRAAGDRPPVLDRAGGLTTWGTPGHRSSDRSCWCR